MTTFLLIRHAANDLIGRAIAGRREGIHLNAAGRRQALLLAEELWRWPLTRVVASPLDRTRETAEPLATRRGLEVEPCPEFLEIDFGEWTGLTFEELDRQALWKRWNQARSQVRVPGGEMIGEVQQRMVQGIERLAAEAPDATVAIVSHSDPIKTAVGYYLGHSLDRLLRLEIALASVSTLELGPGGPRVLGVNWTRTRGR